MATPGYSQRFRRTRNIENESEYSTDSSHQSSDWMHLEARRPSGRCWWYCQDRFCRTVNDFRTAHCQVCGLTRPLETRLSSSSASSEDWRERRAVRHVQRWLMVTEVVSGTGFYAHSERTKREAEELKNHLATLMATACTQVDKVAPKMICAAKVNDMWERVSVKRACSSPTCLLKQDTEKLDKLYWHVLLLEVGTVKCLPKSELFLLTEDMASLSPKAKLYFLRRVLLVENNTLAQEAKTWLKSVILSDKPVMADCFFHYSGVGKTHVEIVVGSLSVSDALVEKGLARYIKPEQQRERDCEGARHYRRYGKGYSCYTSSEESVQEPPEFLQPSHAERNEKSLVGVLDFISELMKKRKERENVTLASSALNQALLTEDRHFVRHFDEICIHGTAALDQSQTPNVNKGAAREFWATLSKASSDSLMAPIQILVTFKILLRKLKDENPTLHIGQDLDQPYYHYLLEMLEKWKKEYRDTQKQTNDAIESIANTFTGFMSQSVKAAKMKRKGQIKYDKRCQVLEAALQNEQVCQVAGQELVQLLLPAVGRKVKTCIEKLEVINDLMVKVKLVHRQVIEEDTINKLTLPHFICRASSLAAITLETLIKDIMKGLLCYHEKDIAYKKLHPENIIIVDGCALLRSAEEQVECTIEGDWNFECLEANTELLGKEGDIFSLGVLILWLACKGDDDFSTACMRYSCNTTLVKLALAKDPAKRPRIENLLASQIAVFPQQKHWKSILVRDYLEEVMADGAEPLHEETSDCTGEETQTQRRDRQETHSDSDQQTPSASVREENSEGCQAPPPPDQHTVDSSEGSQAPESVADSTDGVNGH